MAQTAYDTIGEGYAYRRRSDPRIAQAIEAALGGARTVVNVGAGAGSYEPADRVVLAVEPSAVMIAQRGHRAPACVRASADALPFADGAFDAGMAVLTLHHWQDWRAGMRELRRVAPARTVVLTFDVEAAPGFWLYDYFPDLLALDRQIMPPLKALSAEFGPFQARTLAVPHNCVDGFLGAHWRRPEMYLDPLVRRSMSSFSRIDAAEGLRRLDRDLESGAWLERHAGLMTLEALDLGYRLLVWPGRDA